MVRNLKKLSSRQKAARGSLEERDDLAEGDDTPFDEEDEDHLTNTRRRKRDRRHLSRWSDEDDEGSLGPERRTRRIPDEGGGDSGSGSGGKRGGSGFENITPSQDTKEAETGDSINFSQSAQNARNIVAGANAGKPSELELHARDERKGSDLPPPVKAMLIKSMMRYLVMKGLNREPATRKEMMATVLGAAHRSKGVLKYVLGEASDALKKTVGFQLKTVPADRSYHVKDTYYVTNVLNNGHHAKAILKGQDQASRGLLTVILCLIYCTTDKCIPEDELFGKLHDKVDKRIPPAPEVPGARGALRSKARGYVEGLGDVHDHLATFVRQHYLRKTDTQRPTADGGTESIVSYTMGARSHLEIGAQQVVTVMAEVMGQSVDPSALVELEGVTASQTQSQRNSVH